MREFALAAIEFFRVNSPAVPRQRLIRHDRMQHFVIKHVTQKPRRHERLIKRGIDPNHPILLLDCAENEMFSWAVLSSAAPHHLISAKTPTDRKSTRLN